MKFMQALIFLLLAFAAFAEDTNVFESATVGFKVTKPDDWQFITAQENLDNIKKIELKDEELRQQILKYATAPLVAMLKYPEPFDDLNPSFKVNIKPLGQLRGMAPTKMLELILPQFKDIFHDFSLVQAPMDTTVGQHVAGYMRTNYSLMVPDGRTFPASSEIWIVPRGDYFFLIGAGSRQDEKTGSRDEIAKILSSIEM